MFFSQIILHQENYDEQNEKLHYLPSNSNQISLASPWTYSMLKSIFLQTQESNSQMVNAGKRYLVQSHLSGFE